MIQRWIRQNVTSAFASATAKRISYSRRKSYASEGSSALARVSARRFANAHGLERRLRGYLAALRNPHIHIPGHPRGRIYNYRLGVTADWERIFREATRLDKAIEIDAYPDRQDVDLGLLRIARRCGTRISMGTDAHHPWQLDFIDLALAAALRTKIPADRIVNFLPLDQLRDWLESVRASSRI